MCHGQLQLTRALPAPPAILPGASGSPVTQVRAARDSRMGQTQLSVRGLTVEFWSRNEGLSAYPVGGGQGKIKGLTSGSQFGLTGVWACNSDVWCVERGIP